jgi:hypothetical protein
MPTQPPRSSVLAAFGVSGTPIPLGRTAIVVAASGSLRFHRQRRLFASRIPYGRTTAHSSLLAGVHGRALKGDTKSAAGQRSSLSANGSTPPGLASSWSAASRYTHRTLYPLPRNGSGNRSMCEASLDLRPFCVVACLLRGRFRRGRKRLELVTSGEGVCSFWAVSSCFERTFA